MTDYCENCGKEIISPNYVVNRGGSPEWEEFCECALCDLEHTTEQLKEHLEDFLSANSLHIIINELKSIRKLEENLKNPLTSLNSILGKKFNRITILNLIKNSLDLSQNDLITLKELFDFIEFEEDYEED
jgi:hypothetical protein